MTIVRFWYHDKRRDWRLEETRFGPFNLLVGLSGVGKTSIINALRDVRDAGLSQPPRRELEAEWEMEIESEGRLYCWRAEVVTIEGSAAEETGGRWGKARKLRFITERITQDNTLLVDRAPAGFVFEEKALPKLMDTGSAIALLEAEDKMAPLHRALERILFSDLSFSDCYDLVPTEQLELEAAKYQAGSSLDALRENMELPLLTKVYIAARHHADALDRIRDQYKDIFPAVTDICVDSLSRLDPHFKGRSTWTMLNVAIKEGDTDRWIIGSDISSGMLRTFFHLAELELAPAGTVIVDDEYENSMGVNCLPAVTEHLMERGHDLQFILTSHHPYVIDNIPTKWWRVVSRSGGSVRVRDASEIPALDTSSSQSKFTLLMNSEAYQEGIQ